MSPEQRPEADVNIEFQSTLEDGGATRRSWRGASQRRTRRYATDYPAAVGQHMTNTDSSPFMDSSPAISVRENERGAQIGSGWDPQLASADRRLHDLLRTRTSASA